MSDTKIGCADFTGRVVSGIVPEGEPGSVILRQLYPGEPVDIGIVDQIEPVAAQLTIYPTHRKAWTETDRVALRQFFADRYRDRRRLATLLDCAEVLEEAAHAR
jgi:hypothetical protein